MVAQNRQVGTYYICAFLLIFASFSGFFLLILVLPPLQIMVSPPPLGRQICTVTGSEKKQMHIREPL